MHMLIGALRSFILRVACERDLKMHPANAGLAMTFSTDVIQDVTELNMDIHHLQRAADEASETCCQIISGDHAPVRRVIKD